MFKRIASILTIGLIFALLISINNSLYNPNSNEIYLLKNSSECQIVSREDLTPFSKITGESYYLTDNDVCAELNRLNAKVVFTENIDGNVNYYAYSKDIKPFVRLKGKKVNVHLSVSQKVKVGIPLIYGAY